MCTMSTRVVAPVRSVNKTSSAPTTRAVAAPAGVSARQSAVMGSRADLARVAARATATRSTQVTSSRMHWWEGAGGMQDYLRDVARVPSLEPADCVKMIDNGEMTLLDVREPEDFSDVHAIGATNIALYNRLEGMSLKRIVYAVNGMTGSQLNENFLEQVQAKFTDKDALIAVMCNSGGSYEASMAGLEGKKSRSLISIYLMLKDAGYTNVKHVNGGMREWGASDSPIEGQNIQAWIKKAAMMP